MPIPASPLPAALQARRDTLSRLSGKESNPEIPPVEIVDDVSVTDSMKTSEPVKTLPEVPPPTPRAAVTESVSLENAYVKITIHTDAVSIRDYNISFRFDPLSASIEPKLKTEFILVYRNRRYSVVYAGGYIAFPGDSRHIISFLRNPDPDDVHDKNRPN